MQPMWMDTYASNFLFTINTKSINRDYELLKTDDKIFTTRLISGQPRTLNTSSAPSLYVGEEIN